MIMSETIKQKIKQYIGSKDICVIATCSENKPRASTVNYVADGFTLYIITSGKSTKVRNIRANPNVSVAIDDQGKTKVCLQAEGIAEILGGDEAEQAKKFYSRKRDISNDKPELIDTVIKIELKEIMFSDYSDIKTGLKVYQFKVDE